MLSIGVNYEWIFSSRYSHVYLFFANSDPGNGESPAKALAFVSNEKPNVFSHSIPQWAELISKLNQTGKFTGFYTKGAIYEGAEKTGKRTKRAPRSYPIHRYCLWPGSTVTLCIKATITMIHFLPPW